MGERAATAESVWHGPFDPARTPWLADHNVGRSTVMPAAGYLEMGLAAGRRIFDAPVEITDLQFPHALVLPFEDDDTTHLELQTAVSGEDGILQIASRADTTGSWQQHARGRVRRLFTPLPAPLDLESATAGFTTARTAEEHDRLARRTGLSYGPAFQTLQELHVADDRVLARQRAETGPPTPHNRLRGVPRPAGRGSASRSTHPGFAPPLLPALLMRIAAAVSSVSRARSVSRTTGTKPATASRSGSSNTTETAEAAWGDCISRMFSRSVDGEP
ncbi:polyketide synthase dehydratase domain-containing protein [Streptomyces sp. NPDC001817]|uniref:polyketide synthase dehydratase domain-containing protein n=1 Tax=Streptomyces sp. NPDC001817 TaxID=3154398 RepID=UPI00332EF323